MRKRGSRLDGTPFDLTPGTVDLWVVRDRFRYFMRTMRREADPAPVANRYR